MIISARGRSRARMNPVLSAPDYLEPTEVTRRSERATHAANIRAAKRRAARTDPGLHPATADIDYSRDEMEFILAMHEYQHATGRKFPAYTEVLRVLKSLGYARAAGSGSVSAQ